MDWALSPSAINLSMFAICFLISLAITVFLTLIVGVLLANSSLSCLSCLSSFSTLL